MPVALFSVFDKTGLPEFAAQLNAAGWELLASGGTARVLAGGGLPVQSVADRLAGCRGGGRCNRSGPRDCE